MKKGISFLLAMCLLFTCSLASLAETFVFSFTITEYTGDTEGTGDDEAGEPSKPDEGLLDDEKIVDDPVLAEGTELIVTATDYQESAWSNKAPKFELSLVDSNKEEVALPNGYSYGFARAADGQVDIYSLSNNVYQPYEDGAYDVQLLVLNAQGQPVVVKKATYHLKLDFTPPNLLIKVVNSAIMNVVVGDNGSGVKDVTISGKAPSAAPSLSPDGTLYTFSQTATTSITYKDGVIIARDNAGNETANDKTVSLYVLNASAAAGAMGALGAMGSMGAMSGGFSFGGGGGGRGGSSRAVYHSKSTTTAVVAYNAVELNVQKESMTRLKVGNETLDLELYHNPFLVTEEPERKNSGSFSASFGSWNGDASAQTDTLILAADEETEENSTWVFTGKVYKKLAASGIDYLVLRRGNDVTALSTAGFTAGIRYSMYRAAGLGSGEFEYAVSMSDDGFAMNVTVDGQTYPLSHDPSSEFYYYDVFTGTVDQLNFSEG